MRGLLYRDDAEKKAFQTAVAGVSWDDPSPPTFMFLVAGPWGEGKTHLACTAVEFGPVYIIDTEYRAQHVMSKFQGKPIKRVIAKSYRSLAVAVESLLKTFKPPGTIVLDSATDLQQFAEAEYLVRAGKDKVGLPRNWGDVWAYCDEIFDMIKFSGFNAVFTARVKDEYIADRSTGNLIPAIWGGGGKAIYKMDFAIQLPKGKGVPVCLKNGATGNTAVALKRSMTVGEIIRACQSTPYVEAS